MPDFEKHTYHQEQQNVAGNPNVNKQHFEEHTEVQKSTMQGGVRHEMHQDGSYQRETQIKQTSCPVSQQPASYTEEARRLDQVKEQFDAKTKELDDKKARDDKLAHEKCAKIHELEKESEKAAKEFNKLHAKDAKKTDKLQSKLEEQEAKTMKIAAELAAKQQEQARLEAEKAQEAMAKEQHAKLLAGQLANQREHERNFAQQKLNELEAAEQDMKNKAKELAAHQAQEVQQLEIKQKEMKVNVESAKKAMDELKRRHENEKKDLANNQSKLEKLRAEAKQAEEIAAKHLNERQELEQRIQELDEKARHERDRAGQLNKEGSIVAQDIAAQQKDIAMNQAALQEREKLVQSKVEQKRTIETHAKTQIQNEEIALKKAKDLAGKTEEERRKAQQEVSQLTEEEQRAKKHLYEMDKNATITVEQKPAVVDVYEHKRYETTEPVITEAHISEKKHEESCCQEEKSLPGKIVDGIKGLF